MGLNVAFVDVDQVTDGVKREKTDSERKRMRTDVNVRKGKGLIMDSSELSSYLGCGFLFKYGN